MIIQESSANVWNSGGGKYYIYNKGDSKQNFGNPIF